MERFKVIQLTTTGSYSLGTYKARDANSALKKACKELKPVNNYEHVDFLIYVSHVK